MASNLASAAVPGIHSGLRPRTRAASSSGDVSTSPPCSASQARSASTTPSAPARRPRSPSTVRRVSGGGSSGGFIPRGAPPPPGRGGGRRGLLFPRRPPLAGGRVDVGGRAADVDDDDVALLGMPRRPAGEESG